VEYHHFDPPFADAMWHDPNGITLLCPLCHGRADRGILDQDAVRKANASPWCLQAGYAKDILFVASERIPVRIGSVRFRAETIAKFDEQVIIGFRPPERRGAPVRLNAVFTDPHGRETLRILDNEWRVRVDRFDVQTTQDVLTIRDGPGDVVLQMSLRADSELHIHKLHMQYRGFDIHASEDGFTLSVPGNPCLHWRGEGHGEIGIWMKSTGEVLVCTNRHGGAAVRLGDPK